MTTHHAVEHTIYSRTSLAFMWRDGKLENEEANNAQRQRATINSGISMAVVAKDGKTYLP